jgi:hypothetical protein
MKHKEEVYLNDVPGVTTAHAKAVRSSESARTSCYKHETYKMDIRCEIIPDTKRLKQIVKEFGREWRVISPIQYPQCFNGRTGVHVESLCKKHNRWVEYPSQIIFC